LLGPGAQPKPPPEEDQGLRSVARAEPREHYRELPWSHIEVFAHSPPQHRRGDISSAAFLLGLVQDEEHDTLLVCEPIANIRNCGTTHEAQ
jgi:hypothetical protein